MITGIFTIYDSKAEAFLQPFFSQSVGTAIREFTSAAETADHQFCKYAADYTLFHIAQWDEVEGHIEVFAAHANLGTALQMQQLTPHGLADADLITHKDIAEAS